MDRGEPGSCFGARHEAASLEDVFLAAVGDIGLRERVRDCAAPLSSAVVRCHVRRLLGAGRCGAAAGAARRDGRPGGAVALARLGRALGERARGSLDPQSVAQAIVAGPALAAAAAGMALAVSLPGPRRRSGPSRRRAVRRAPPSRSLALVPTIAVAARRAAAARRFRASNSRRGRPGGGFRRRARCAALAAVPAGAILAEGGPRCRARARGGALRRRGRRDRVAFGRRGLWVRRRSARSRSSRVRSRDGRARRCARIRSRVPAVLSGCWVRLASPSSGAAPTPGRA